MNARQLVVASVAAVTLVSLLAVPSLAAGTSSRAANPDFTQGDKIPEGWTHDWNLGATGARGWMFSDKLVTADARQIYVTKVEKDSPADGILAVGDVILGVANKPFSHDPRTELGKALTTAESEAGGGDLSIRCLPGDQNAAGTRRGDCAGIARDIPFRRSLAEDSGRRGTGRHRQAGQGGRS
ncbi:MAG: DUF6288 domain-containing protein [bacterium]